MNVALLVDKGKLGSIQDDQINVVILNIEDDKIHGAQNESIRGNDIAHLVSWLRSKSIEMLYLFKIEKDIKKYLFGLGVTAREQKDLTDDWLYNSFVF